MRPLPSVSVLAKSGACEDDVDVDVGVVVVVWLTNK
jgi:hypothetical protein